MTAEKAETCGRRRRKILYVATEDWYFISDTLPLAKAALAQGYDVHVAARSNGKEGPILEAGLTFHALQKISRSGIGVLSEAASVAELTRLYRRLSPDLVHHIALKAILYGAIAARGVPRLASVNAIMGLGYVFTSQSAKARALRPFMAAAMRLALAADRSRTIVQNTDDLDAVAALSPHAHANLRLLRGSGVDCEKFTPQPEPEGAPVVVLPGRLLRDKGVREFAAAARSLKSEGIAARFCLVGEPDADNPASITQAEIDGWVKDGIIEHWGFRADMPAVYAISTLVCLPSYREGLPRVLLEAAACTRAAVTTDAPGCRECVEPGVNGWLVPVRDAAALTDALREALSNADVRQQYAAEGRRRVEQHFAAPIIIGQTLALYDELLKR